MAGRNRALPRYTSANESYNYSNGYRSKDKPCIFLSHISIDKKIVEEIANYIMYKGDLDVYFDKYDDELQQAEREGNPRKITELIERGINASTHVMCLISEETKNSWWVPYEIGYGKKANIEIASLNLKGNTYLPDYLKIGKILKGTMSLNEYIKKVISDSIMKFSINESLEPHDSQDHPLDDILDRSL